ncbi:MAG: DUF202 domain-containing protein [Pirellulaceae bacterium]
MTDSNDPAPAPNLALVRTDLANERTLLAYGRTALMVVGTGVSLIKFFDPTLLWHIAGWTLVIVGTLIGVVGVIRFRRLQCSLRG